MRTRLCQGGPGDAEVLCLLGELCYSARLFERARELLAAGTRPGVSRRETLLALGRCHVELGEYAQAETVLTQLAADHPTFAEVRLQLGIALHAQGRHAEALARYEEARGLEPGLLRARYNAGLARLTLGDYRRGFRELAVRHLDEDREARRARGGVLWLGRADVSNKRILVHEDQGLGDTLQFARFLPLLAARGARIAVQVHPTLARLFRGLPWVEFVAETGAPPPPHDFRSPFASLPFAFGCSPGTIPDAGWLGQASWLRAENQEGPVAANRRLRVGFCWAGNRRAPHDASRSLEPTLLGSLAGLANLEAVSLQLGAGPLRLAGGSALPAGPAEGSDFMDTALLVAGLDLVVSVDTSVAHLAGALGKRTWVLLSTASDWRWMASGATTPWYPRARLFRQESPGDWGGVIGRVAEALAQETQKV